MKNWKAAIAGLAVAAMIAIPAFAAIHTGNSDQDLPIDEFGNTPIMSTFQYEPYVTQLPVTNPSPTPVSIGDEIIQVQYVDMMGTLYDVQANLTKSNVKIFNDGALLASGPLTPAEVGEFRETGTTQHVQAQCGNLCVAVVGALIAGAIYIAYEEWSDARECRRGQQTALNNMVNDAMSCVRSGGHYTVDEFPQAELCGAGGYGHCTQ